jgi:dihydrofolate reductase
MILSIIAGIGKNNELGLENKLLWNLPRDMKHFRKTTSGHPVIIGQKTFESIGRPLPNRRNIILTRNTEYKKEGIEVAHSIEETLELARTSPQPAPLKGEGENSEKEVFVIGGAQIYKQMIDRADRLYITHVDKEFTADTFFPTIDMSVWKEISKEHFDVDDTNNLPMDFVVYEKLAK